MPGRMRLAESAQKARAADVKGKGKGPETTMWVDRYRPKKFADLLGDEVRSSRTSHIKDESLIYAFADEDDGWLPWVCDRAEGEPRNDDVAQGVGPVRVQATGAEDKEAYMGRGGWWRGRV
jgi:hypothetical protein